MPHTGPSKWRFSTRVLLPLIFAGIATAVLVTGVLLVATHESDQVARAREYKLVSHIVSNQIAKIAHDQQSVTIWDDAVRNTKLQPDLSWVSTNLGVWMYEYFGHDRTFVLNDRDEPIYAMVDGADADLSRYGADSQTVSPLVRRLRTMLRIAAPGAAAASPDKFSAAELIRVEDRPAIASVLPIVSDSGTIEQSPGSEYFLVSIRLLDGSFLQDLMQQFLLEGMRFAWVDDPRPAEASFPLRDTTGDRVGYLIWKPLQPGRTLFSSLAPVLVLALLLTVAGVSVLVHWLRRASTELQASEAQAQHLAFHDALTGLPNRSLFFDRLDRRLTEARRDGSRIALLYLDLDRFKNINDTLGHAAGDDLISEVARRLTALVRGKDCVARLGGDEFAILQTEIESPADATALSERIIQSVASPFRLLGSEAFVGASIGVALAPDAGGDRAELVRKADIALYRAKLEGRNRFRIFSEEMDLFVQRRRRIEAELREATAGGNQLYVVYQPLYSAQSGGVCGAEALLRWNHPDHGLVPPGVFIPIAEESGLIQAIGDWVLREACANAKRWPIRRIAVNVSAVQFRAPNFASRVLDILRETELEPWRLEIEITESALLDSAEIVEPTFTALREAGVRIALDDFGTGYSSLTYLQRFPVDKIKIDRSFVHNLDSDPHSDAIVKAIVDLARAMHVEVTAEGVETTAQRDALKRIGCDELQGYLLSMPLELAAADSLFHVIPGAGPARVAAA